MFPGMGGVGGRGMNPAKMKQMMKQMGIDVKELKDVEEVIIKTADSNIIIENANVSIMTVQGSETYQIVGDAKEVPKSLEIPVEDIKLVMEQTGVSEEEARKALKNFPELWGACKTPFLTLLLFPFPSSKTRLTSPLFPESQNVNLSTGKRTLPHPS